MAIDSAQKRLSALSYGQVYINSIQPDGTIAQGDRQAITWAYSGVLAQTVTIASGGQSMNDLTLIFDD